LQKQFDHQARMLTLIPSFPYALLYEKNEDPHLLAMDVAIIKTHFAVAENGLFGHRRLAPKPVLPFICRHLMVVVDAGNMIFHYWKT
jgi:hypothetical protein